MTTSNPVSVSLAFVCSLTSMATRRRPPSASTLHASVSRSEDTIGSNSNPRFLSSLTVETEDPSRYDDILLDAGDWRLESLPLEEIFIEMVRKPLGPLR